jgi:hypothetical protein
MSSSVRRTQAKRHRHVKGGWPRGAPCGAVEDYEKKGRQALGSCLSPTTTVRLRFFERVTNSIGRTMVGRHSYGIAIFTSVSTIVAVIVMVAVLSS